jgi:hypothetical protein
MRRVQTLLIPLVLLALPLALAACRRSESPAPPGAPTPQVSAPAPSFRITGIELGRAVGADRRVTAPTTQFAPSDTIYASVGSDGSAGSVTLRARWTYEDGQIVNETSETITPGGPAATEFHIAKPDGWPPGRYKVEITSNGMSAGAREFEVR